MRYSTSGIIEDSSLDTFITLENIAQWLKCNIIKSKRRAVINGNQITFRIIKLGVPGVRGRFSLFHCFSQRRIAATGSFFRNEDDNMILFVAF